MFRRRIYLLLLRIAYYKSLLVGYFPAPIDWTTLEFQMDRQRTYRIASAFVHVCSLAVIPLTYTQNVYARSYMADRPMLRLVYSVTNTAKSLAVIFLIRNIWLNRHKAMQEFRDYLEGANRYAEAFGRLDDDRLSEQMERLMIWKFVANIANTLLTHNILLLMDSNGTDFLVMLVVSLLLHAYLNSAQLQLQFVLSQLCRQFAFVNNELRRIHGEMASAGDTEPPHNLAARLRLLSRMHWDFYRRTERIFRYFQVPTITILMKTFTTNVNMIYHSWLFMTQSIAADLASNLSGFMLTLVFYWDAVLFLNLLERVLNECNRTGAVLRDFLDFYQLTQQPDVSDALNQFADHLRRRKLAFNLCGLFELNLATSVEFFFLVFVQVSVLMQFDIKNAMEASQQNLKD